MIMCKVILLVHTKNQLWIANAKYSFDMSSDNIIREFMAPVNVLCVIYDLV